MTQLSVDIGGTFTDCLVSAPGEPLAAFKAPTTPSDPVQGVLDALAKAAAASDSTLPEFLGRVELFVHGTTLGTNVLLTKTGAKVGLLTTAGFRDVLEIRRGIRHAHRSMFDQFHPPYDPLVPRKRRLGVRERLRYTGEVIDALDVVAAEEAIEELLADGCESIAIGLLHAHANPVHELALRALVERLAPDRYVVCSHEVLRTQGEFERFSSTVVSAYIGPATARYLKRLEQRLGENGLSAPVLIVRSNGLTQTVDECASRAIELLISGPAAAPSAALTVAQARGLDDVIEVDMGGTSFDVCVIRNGVVPTTKDAWVGEERVAIKMVDVAAVGAGGGSIAHIDNLGLLRVGPQSAGAEPGPAAYGRSELATVTDADLVLGYLAPDYFLGGEMAVDVDRSVQALAAVGDQLGLDPQQTALAVFTTINAVMADAITETCTKQGHDVRDFALVAGGGAGGIHCASVAALLEIPQVIFPAAGALLSALGMLTMDVGQELARSEPWNDAEGVSAERLGAAFDALEPEHGESFDRIGIPQERVLFRRSVEMRYEGQYHQLEVDLPGAAVDSAAIAGLITRFHERYHALYGYSMPWLGVEFLEVHLRASASRDAPFELASADATSADATSALKGQRDCLTAQGERTLPVYERARLRSGHGFAGPALVDSPTTTLLVPDSFDAEVDEHLNVVLSSRSARRGGHGSQRETGAAR